MRTGEGPKSILRREGIRQLPGICWYPDKRTGQTVNQGGTADKFYSSLTEQKSVRGVFFSPAEIKIRFVRFRDSKKGEKHHDQRSH